MAFGEIIAFAYDTFCSNKVRFILTALGMVIGTASLILVVTIGMTGRQFVLNQIQAIGTNEIWAEYLGGAPHISNSNPDPLTIDDLHAVQEVVPGIVASSPVTQLSDRVPVGNGKEKDVTILGVSPEYLRVRNLVVPSGRFFDQEDSQAHNKVGVITEKMAIEVYGSSQAAVGKIIKLNGLPFTIIGTFKERVETFGQSEIVDNTMLIPYSVSRYFMEIPSVKLLYFSMEDPSMVIPATAQIKRVLQSRHRVGVGLRRLKSHRASGDGRSHRDWSDLGAASDFHGHSAGEWDWNHEHHAGDSDFAHPGDRDPKSHWRDQPGNPVSVSCRGDSDLVHRRGRWHRDRPGYSLLGAIPNGIPDSYFRPVRDYCDCRFFSGRGGLWHCPSGAGGAA